MARLTAAQASGFDVRPWRGLELVRALGGGARSHVVLARLRGQPVVVRQSARPPASLEWELDLLEHLAGHGLRVPRVVPADDGRRHTGGLVVQEFLAGSPPRTGHDWSRVVEALGVLHARTVGWAQRPGFASSADLLGDDRGGDVRLDLMPADLVRQVRAAWQRVQSGGHCVVHGDPGPGNVLIDGDEVALLDWDEARADVRWFDFAAAPVATGLPLPADISHDALAAAGVAWETATCWVAEPEYARRCAHRLRTHRLVGDHHEPPEDA